ncbi:MAG: CoB--CoM heterodisulfide reductase iron-sulfur subunit A family protein [Thermoplasmata archaeon]|nr:MAG: CoB--CoM heterodisulfide reductase iron-sulfur subunit A family protein [Thermoplasmata archaeon]
MVVGGGISGMQSALDLADSGFKVYLLERYPTIGGVMAQLDKTFPTNDCAMCIMAPKLVATGRHHNIEIIGNAEVSDVEGEAGHFYVTIKKHPLKIDEEKCTGCGVCAQKCPSEALDEFNESLRRRKAVSIRYPQAIPLIFDIDQNKCIGCGICAEECKAKAVVYEQEEQKIQLEVGSIILSPGFDKFRPDNLQEYGYGVYKNVVSSIEFERILSATGPYLGTVLRPSDGDVPENVAFIQCVGSRDNQHGSNPYCSAVCCMYAMKEAVIAQEHTEGLKSHIFFMDIRAHGKEFDDYYERCEKEHGIVFTRARVAGISEDPTTKNLSIRYVEGGEIKEKEFNLVVLGVGLNPPENVEKLAEVYGIELNHYKFCETDNFKPLETTRPGIYVSGAFSSPKDIPDTVAQASGAAAKASGIVASKRWTETTEKEFPPERDITGEDPRIGVFVCHCGINIGGVVDVPGVVEYAKSLPNVVYAEHNLYTCSQDTQKRIREHIKEHNLNRTIVASCTPRTHEPLFRNTTAEGGLNPYLFEMANIRDQCSWVHMHEPESATTKAKDLLRIAVAKSRLLEPLDKKYLPITQKGLVIGGGLAGMTAALGIAEQGYETYLIEKEAQLGGNLSHIHYSLNPGDNGDESKARIEPQAFLKDLIEKVQSNDKIKLHLNSKIKNIEGFMGNFKTTVENGGKEEEFEHGVVVVASGAYEYKPTEYLYGTDDKILTQRELEAKLANNEYKANTVVMIQCVGSRDEEHGWCSRVCCSEAVKNALKVKEANPDAQIYILYKDMRTYGFKEDYYKTASEKGVLFIRYDDESKPEVTNDGGAIKVRVKDHVTEDEIELQPDNVILSAGTMPNPDNENIGKMLKVPLNKYKFFLEAHMKLRPVDFATEGVFLCGLSHGPKLIDETISQACGAVARAATVLAKDQMVIEPTISNVIDENCDGCAYCVDPCPFKAITLIEYNKEGAVKKTVEVNEAACKGCGVCMATCPKKGIVVKGFRLDQLNAMIEAALEVS